jgi:hypothetical protein
VSLNTLVVVPPLKTCELNKNPGKLKMRITQLVGLILLSFVSHVFSAEVKLTELELRSMICQSQWVLSKNKMNHVKFSDDGKARFYKKTANGEIMDTGNKILWSLTEAQEVKVGPTTYRIIQENNSYLFKVMKTNKDDVKIGAIHYRKKLK